jgi:Poxvirus A32 protein
MPRKKQQINPNDIVNFYETEDVKKHLYNHFNPNFNLTQMNIPFRLGVIASSGGGKTNAVLNLLKLLSQGEGTFSHIYVINVLEEPLYEMLRDKLKERITFYKRLCDLPEPKELKPKDDGHVLVIFDDLVVMRNQEKIENYFIYGRKINDGKGASLIYISQKYYSIPKIIRAQMNYLILLKIGENKDIKLILRDNSLDLSASELYNIYRDATSIPLSFLKIDRGANDDNRKLSKNFTEFYNLDDWKE